jgi:hypothetical protein
VADALTSDRPYRRAMIAEAALNILRERSGRMYDPDAVDTFIAIHRDIVLTGVDAPEHRQVLERITRTHQTAPAAADTSSAPPGAASDDVLAFVSLARLVSGEVSLKDVLALASNMILHLVPGATGAWFIPDPAADSPGRGGSLRTVSRVDAGNEHRDGRAVTAAADKRAPAARELRLVSAG